jgi:signal transduction histidine kinase
MADSEQPHGWLEKWFWVDHEQTPVVLRLAPAVAFASLIVWLVEALGPDMSTWDRIGSPMVSTLILLSALLLSRKPVWRTPIVLGGMIASSIYLIGKLIGHLYFPGTEQVYAVMSVALYGPVIYLSAFALFKRGARRYSWTHYGITVLIMAITELWPPAPETRQVLQAKVMMTVLSPAYIIALSFMVRLRESVTAKERAAHEDKERMLAMMSHEIRGPLQTMLTSVDLLATKVTDAPSQRALARIGSVAQQLERHLKDLMEFNRVNNPELAIEQTTFDLEALVDSVRDNHQADALAKGLVLNVIQPERGATVQERDRWKHTQGDPTRLTQVLNNLVSNAIKYTLVGHVAISISTPPRRPDWVTIEVEDTGVGVEPQDLQAIFEPFVRVIPPRMKPPEGSGLGLVIARKLVMRLGGQLNVSSTPGQGSVFTVMLPLSGAAR